MPNHIISSNVNEYPEKLKAYADDLDKRSIIVKKAEPLLIECIVRGYITGSGWKDYQKTGKVCGIKLRDGYSQAEKLDNPLFTPSTKAEQGLHDENISFEKAVEIVGKDLAEKLKEISLKIYKSAGDYAEKHNIILADTKFEFGFYDDELILIDEVLTPDSSRFWPKELYQIGSSPPSLDKQFVRDYLEKVNFSKEPPAPELPDDIVLKTADKYKEAFKILTGNDL